MTFPRPLLKVFHTKYFHLTLIIESGGERERDCRIITRRLFPCAIMTSAGEIEAFEPEKVEA
jgi:hypothetical protein